MITQEIVARAVRGVRAFDVIVLFAKAIADLDKRLRPAAEALGLRRPPARLQSRKSPEGWRMKIANETRASEIRRDFVRGGSRENLRYIGCPADFHRREGHRNRDESRGTGGGQPFLCFALRAVLYVVQSVGLQI
jgi:hypothetical protein